MNNLNRIEKYSDSVAFFDRESFYTKGQIERDIDSYRKGGFVLCFRDSDGKPLHGVRVLVKHKKHEFKFGCSSFLLDEFPEEERNKAYREKFTEIFNYAVVPLYWDTLEPEKGKPRFGEDSEKIWRRPAIDKIVKFCRKNGIGMKGHCLMYHSFNPDWIPENHRELKMAVDKRLREIGEKYGNDFLDVDVINELHSKYRNLYGYPWKIRNYPIADEKDHVNWCFAEAKKYFPFSKLHWNEGCYEVFGDSYVGEKSYYYMMLEKYLREGVPIEAIGMQFHAFGNIGDGTMLFNPTRTFDIFDMYSRFDRPIHLSEVSIPSYGNDEEGEQIQKELCERMFSLWFSRKNVEAIVWWNLVDGTAYGDENKFHAGLLRNDMTEKPAYRTIKNLINSKWHTEFSAETDSDGRISFCGFYGDYEIETVCNGVTVTKEITLSKENTGYLHSSNDGYGLRSKFISL